MNDRKIDACRCNICSRIVPITDAILNWEQWYECPMHGIICSNCTEGSGGFMTDPTCILCNLIVTQTMKCNDTIGFNNQAFNELIKTASPSIENIDTLTGTTSPTSQTKHRKGITKEQECATIQSQEKWVSFFHIHKWARYFVSSLILVLTILSVLVLNLYAWLDWVPNLLAWGFKPISWKAILAVYGAVAITIGVFTPVMLSKDLLRVINQNTIISTNNLFRQRYLNVFGKIAITGKKTLESIWLILVNVLFYGSIALTVRYYYFKYYNTTVDFLPNRLNIILDPLTKIILKLKFVKDNIDCRLSEMSNQVDSLINCCIAFGMRFNIMLILTSLTVTSFVIFFILERVQIISEKKAISQLLLGMSISILIIDSAFYGIKHVSFYITSISLCLGVILAFISIKLNKSYNLLSDTFLELSGIFIFMIFFPSFIMSICIIVNIYSNSIADILSSKFFIPLYIITGVLLYRLKRGNLLIYSVLEFFFAIATIYIAVISPTNSLITKSAVILGGIYVLVRALDNLGNKLPQTVKILWNNWFPSKS